MANKKNTGDLFWIIIAWLVAGAIAYLFYVKAKMLFF